ncbi:MAG: hypothetical protein JST51_20460 [Armatimonadetes bacterium]|nr:hypothetical protein [Armatimonadota bacterium]
MGTYNLRPLILMQDNPCPNRLGDGLRLQDVADTVAGAAVGNEGPFTIGVFGPWGTGKTSLLNLAREMVDGYGQDSTVTVWFNAWQHEREPEPLFALIAAIVNAIRKSDSKAQTKAEILEKIKAAIVAIATSMKIKAIPGLEVDFAKLIDAYQDLEDANKILPFELAYADAYEMLTDVSKNGQFKIVVFIDDLDRCDPEKAVHLLESIKLILNQRGFVFVLALADNVVTKYLQYVYTDKFKLDPERQWGESYLEKIVNLPVRVPSHRAVFVKYARDQVVKLAARHELWKPAPGNRTLVETEEQVRGSLFIESVSAEGQLVANTAKAGEFSPELFTLASIYEPLASGANYNPRQFVRLANSYLVKARLWQSQQDLASSDALILATDAILEARLSPDELQTLADDDDLCGQTFKVLAGTIKPPKGESEGGAADPRLALMTRVVRMLSDPAFKPLVDALSEHSKDNWFTDGDKRKAVRRVAASQGAVAAALSLHPEIEREIRRELKLDDDVVVSQSHCDAIEELKLASVGLGTEDMQALATRFRNLKRLHLEYNKIGDTGVETLAGSARLSNLTLLWLTDCGLTAAGVGFLANSAYLKNLERLGLAQNGVETSGMVSIANSANFGELRALNLHECGLKDADIRTLADSKGFPKLEYIQVRGNDVSKEMLGRVKSKFPGIEIDR